MSDARSFAELAGKLGKVSASVPKANRVGIERAALAAKKELLTAPGAPRFLSGVGKKGAKVGVRYDIKGFHNPTALVRWVGPVHLADAPTKPHDIFRKRKRARGRGSRRANRQIMYEQLFGGTGALTGGPLRTPYGPKQRVSHPGTKGKRFFASGMKRVAVVAPREFAAGALNVVRDSLR